jgi:hypothetical protein
MTKSLSRDTHVFDKYGNMANVTMVECKILLTLR